jgi:two-component system LytT family sensor kinase
MGLFTPRNDDTASRLPSATDTMTILMSILGFWMFYAVLVTLRSYVIDFPAQWELALRRGIVTFIGMGVTVLVWQVMRPFDGHRLAVRISVAAFITIPAAFAIASVNYYFFNVYDQGSLVDVEKFRAAQDGPIDMWLEILETAISRYFFLIAWAALYIALGYAQDVREAERRAAEFARAAQLSELRALRYQVNPHFLFNSLNSLSALVMANRRDEAEAMIMNLASFYRTALSGDSSGDVPLHEELSVQRLYLGIEGTRFGDRLQTHFDIPEALENWMVPGLILQPLVENAIKHGVSRTSSAVSLTISAREEAGQLAIQLRDDAPHPTAPATPSGIGLANVRDRLFARYGNMARLDAYALPDRGFCVTLVLPRG